jgi:hypothetical protein
MLLKNMHSNTNILYLNWGFQVQEKFGRLFGQKMMEDTRAIVTWAQDIYTGEMLTQSLSIAVQFLSNMATSCPPNQDLVWDNFCPIMK